MGDSEAKSSPLALFLGQFRTQRAFVLALEVLQRALADLQRCAVEVRRTSAVAAEVRLLVQRLACSPINLVDLLLLPSNT